MPLARKGRYSATVRRMFGGWRLEVWEDGVVHPVYENDHLDQPRYAEKMLAINHVIQRKQDAPKDQAWWDAFDARAQADDAKGRR